MSNLQVTMSSKIEKTTGKEYWEGVVSFKDLNLAPAKLRKSDGCTHFSTRSACAQAARSLSKKLGYEVEISEPASKQAAKKTPVPKKKVAKSAICSPPWCCT